MCFPVANEQASIWSDDRQERQYCQIGIGPKSGLGSEAAKDLQDLAERLNKSKDLNSPVKVLEDAGIDILVRRSDTPEVFENDKQCKGNVTVDFLKRAEFEPLVPVTLHSFENQYDSQDKNGDGFLARIYEEASNAMAKITV